MPVEDKLSIIIPSYNEQDNIARTFHTICELLNANHIPFEIIFVDDGSKDLTYQRIQELSSTHPEAKGISFHEISARKPLFLPDLKSHRAPVV